MSKTDTNAEYSRETILKKRKFPKKNAIILGVLVLIQILLAVAALLYKETPLDIIKEYNVTVVPYTDGKINIEYDILWQANDEDEPLTWVKVGVPNPDFVIDPGSGSDAVSTLSPNYSYSDSTVRVDLRESYRGGETVRIGFSVTVDNLICHDGNGGYISEIVPGWFNEIPIEHYTFKWAKRGATPITEPDSEDKEFYIYEGSLKNGEWRSMQMSYDTESFDVENVYSYFAPFDGDGAYDGFEDSELAFRMVMLLFVMILIVPEVYLIDSFVSYSRGRGFMRSGGYHVHTYGYSNPLYITHIHTTGGGGYGSGRPHGGGGGCVCACACACACAGGGRAGCSQKDGYRRVENGKPKIESYPFI